MKMISAIVLVLLAQTIAADPLFESHDSLGLKLTGPFRTIERSKDKSEAWPARLAVDDTIFDVELSVRGNNRLKKCRFPPLRLRFKKGQTKDTLFHKQKNLKMVVVCDRTGPFMDYLRTEYLIYRSMLLLTPAAYQVRWADIEFADTDRGESRHSAVFFIERKSRVAKRLDMKTTDVKSVNSARLDAEQAGLVNLFAYLIANADYSILRAPGDEECCHNAKLLQDESEKFHAILYDFDSSGLVDAKYATPPANVGISKVTRRVYRGFCRHNGAVLQAARQSLLEHEQEILALFQDDEVLRDKRKKKALKYLAKGFDTLREDKRFQKEIIDDCRG